MQTFTFIYCCYIRNDSWCEGDLLKFISMFYLLNLLDVILFPFQNDELLLGPLCIPCSMSSLLSSTPLRVAVPVAPASPSAHWWCIFRHWALFSVCLSTATACPTHQFSRHGAEFQDTTGCGCSRSQPTRPPCLSSPSRIWFVPHWSVSALVIVLFLYSEQYFVFFYLVNAAEKTPS